MTRSAALRRFALPALALVAALPVLASSGGGETQEPSIPPPIVVPATRQILPEEILKRMRANLRAREQGTDFAPAPSRPMPGSTPGGTGGQ